MVRRGDVEREKRETRWKRWGWGDLEVEFGDGSRPSYLTCICGYSRSTLTKPCMLGVAVSSRFEPLTNCFQECSLIRFYRRI